MTLAALLSDAAPRLTSAERRVADVVLADPQLVAFGTVAQVAEQSGTSGPSVVRCAVKLGFSGFAAMQAAAQAEIADALRPAAARIRERPAPDVVANALAFDIENVRATLEGIDALSFNAAVRLLADRQRRVFVLTSELARGAGVALVTQLDLLREGIVAVSGSPVRSARQLADVKRGDVVVAIDHRRYERWLLDARDVAVAAGAIVIALADRPHAPVAVGARHTFVVSARGVGPFDSQVGTLALVQALNAGVAARLQRSATSRLDAIERSWIAAGELLDG
ncbi:MAG TPA: MurR/RpiR family transcriptional regulator [Acidimicrobiia bacterium]|nr:MurR/RpiR family transcriptional regulator [Acidimicrobiia bacterium]